MPNRFWGAVQRGFGRLADGFVPGDIYNPQTNTYQNVWKGISMMPVVAAANVYAGPIGGIVAKRMTSNYVDGKNLLDFSRSKPGEVGAPTGPQAETQGGVPMGNPVSVSNLGFPGAPAAQSPGSAWAGYLQSPGSVNNFGNTQFGNGAATQAGSWSPASSWGQQVIQPKPDQGSNLGFGNNVGNFVSGGGGGGSGGGSYASSHRMPGVAGGRPAGESMLAIARRWARS